MEENIAAKMTGAGGGGFIICLTSSEHDPSSLVRFKAKVLEKGLKIEEMEVDKKGVNILQATWVEEE